MLRYKIIYSILLLLLWAMRILYTFRITAVVFYVFLLLPFVLLVLFWIQQAGVKVGMAVPNRVVGKKKTFTVEIQVENKNRLPVGKLVVKLEYRNILSERWTRKKVSFFVGKGGEKRILTLCSDYGAKLEVRITGARLYSVLNLFSIQKAGRRKHAGNAVSVTVLPEIYELEENPVCDNPYVMPEGSLYSDTKCGDDSTEVFDIREYAQGDRINRIHWKLSTKKDELMVKEFGLPIDCSVLVLLNLGCRGKLEKRLKYRDTALETALSLSNRMVGDRQVHYLAWYGGRQGGVEKARISDPEDFYAAVDMLLQQDAGLGPENMPLLYFSEFYKEQYSNIFYITTDLASYEPLGTMVENRKSAWLSLVVVREQFQQEGEKEGLGLGYLEEDGIIVEFVSPDTIKEDLKRIACRKGGAIWDGV